jgi:hypothetical protein
MFLIIATFSYPQLTARAVVPELAPFLGACDRTITLNVSIL